MGEKGGFNVNLYVFRPSGQPCIETKEFDLVRNMLIAAVEERYRDAGTLLFCLFLSV